MNRTVVDGYSGRRIRLKISAVAGQNVTTIYIRHPQVVYDTDVEYVPTSGAAILKGGVKPKISTIRSTFSGKIVFFGDSLTLAYANGMAGIMANSPTIVNAGVGGEKIADGLARIQTIIDLVPDICVVGFGINDLTGNTILSAMQSGTQSIIDALVTADITPVILTVSPWKGNSFWLADRQTDTDNFNAWLKTRGHAVVDSYALLEDPNNPDALQARFEHTDHLHLISAGYAALGRLIDNSLPVPLQTLVTDINKDALQYNGPLKLSIQGVDGAYFWPSSPKILLRTGVDNAVYNADGTGKEFASKAFALAALASLADDTYLFGGTKGAALYSVDMSSKAAKIKNILADAD
jgi:lysophospholipase L1-like esterase